MNLIKNKDQRILSKIMRNYKILLILLNIYSLIFFCSCLRGRSSQLANNYYAHRAYAQAIPLFEAALTNTNNTGIKSKLANCYRILGKPKKALPLYADIVKEDKPAPKDLLYFAEVLMNLARYDEAKIWLIKFAAENPDDSQGKVLLDNCDKIKTIKPFYQNVTLTPFTKNDESDDNAPVFFRNGIVYASDRAQNFQLLKEKNPLTGREFIALYYSEPVNDTGFTEPRFFSAKLAQLNRNTSNASFTRDEKRIYFSKNSEEPARNGNYNMQIYSAETDDFEHWKNISRLNFCSLESNYMYPAVSPDGKLLFFVTDKGDGAGGLDIYWVHKTKKGWSRPENLGSQVNTPANECFPYYSSDNKLFFCSKGHIGFGGYDIFFTQYDSIKATWHTPVNMGTPINSPYDDISIAFSNKDSLFGAFTSSRGGRGDAIYFFKINALTKK